MNNNLAEYRAKSFISSKDSSSIAYEVKRVRAIWDPSLAVPGTNRRGGWRCPVGTRFGGQITDRFGRSCGWGVARRLANTLTDLGERVENIDDRKRKRRLERRNRRVARRLNDGGLLERGAGRIAEALDGGDSTPTNVPNTPNTPNVERPGLVERAAGRAAAILDGNEPRQGGKRRRRGVVERAAGAVADRLEGDGNDRQRTDEATTDVMTPRVNTPEPNRRRTTRQPAAQQEPEQVDVPQAPANVAPRPRRRRQAAVQQRATDRNRIPAPAQPAVAEGESAPDERSFRNVRNRFPRQGLPERADWRDLPEDSDQRIEMERRFGRYYDADGNINGRGRLVNEKLNRDRAEAPAPRRPRRVVPRGQSDNAARSEEVRNRNEIADILDRESEQAREPQNVQQPDPAPRPQGVDVGQVPPYFTTTGNGRWSRDQWRVTLNEDANGVPTGLTASHPTYGVINANNWNELLPQINNAPADRNNDGPTNRFEHTGVAYTNSASASDKANQLARLDGGAYYYVEWRGNGEDRGDGKYYVLDQAMFDTLRNNEALRGLWSQIGVVQQAREEQPNNMVRTPEQLPRQPIEQFNLSAFLGNEAVPGARMNAVSASMLVQSAVERAQAEADIARPNWTQANRDELAANLLHAQEELVRANITLEAAVRAREQAPRDNDALPLLVRAYTDREVLKVQHDMFQSRLQEINAEPVPNIPLADAAAAPAPPAAVQVAPAVRNPRFGHHADGRDFVITVDNLDATQLRNRFAGPNATRFRIDNASRVITAAQNAITRSKRNQEPRIGGMDRWQVGREERKAAATMQVAVANMIVAKEQLRRAERENNAELAERAFTNLMKEYRRYHIAKNKQVLASQRMAALGLRPRVNAAAAAPARPAGQGFVPTAMPAVVRDIASIDTQSFAELKDMNELIRLGTGAQAVAAARQGELAAKAKTERSQKAVAMNNHFLRLADAPSTVDAGRDIDARLQTAANYYDSVRRNFEAENGVISQDWTVRAASLLAAQDEFRFWKSARDAFQERQANPFVAPPASMIPEISRQQETVMNGLVQSVMKDRVGDLGKYMISRYGETESPWKLMTPERLESLRADIRARGPQSAAAKQQIQEWAIQAYGHPKILGRDGKLYRFRVSNVSVDHGGISVSVKIENIDANGNLIALAGSSERAIFFSEKEVSNQYLSMEPAYQGNGLATLYNNHAYMYMREAGMTHAKVSAGLDSGPYVWGRVGFVDNDMIPRETINSFKKELTLFEKYGFGLVQDQEQYNRIAYLIRKADANPRSVRHLDFILALEGQRVRSDKGQRGIAAGAREAQIAKWMASFYRFGTGKYKFNDANNMLTRDPRTLVPRKAV